MRSPRHLQNYLEEAWNHSVTQRNPPRVADCAADVTREELLAKKAELDRVKARCHISRVYAAFIDRVLAANS